VCSLHQLLFAGRQYDCNVPCIFMTDGRWNKQHLTYRFHNYSPDLPRDTIRSVFQQAFKVSLMSFTIRYDTVLCN